MVYQPRNRNHPRPDYHYAGLLTSRRRALHRRYLRLRAVRRTEINVQKQAKAS